MMEQLKNECLVDLLAQDMNEKNCIDSHNKNLQQGRKISDTSTGLLKNMTAVTKSNTEAYVPSSKYDSRSTIEKVFESQGGGEYQRGVDIFETQFDHQLTSLGQESDNMKMDNATFLKIS